MPNKIPARFWMLFILFFALLEKTQAESTKIYPNGLVDGEYLFEKTDYGPTQIFFNEQDAQKFSENVKKNPKLITPTTYYFNIFLKSGGFILHQLKNVGGTNFVSNKNFFVSSSKNGAWVFEETANRITILNGEITSASKKDPYAALLLAGKSYIDELEALGLNLIITNSNSWTSSNQFSGKFKYGGMFSGSVLKDSDGRITNILCLGSSVTYDQKFDIFYDQNSSNPSKVLVSNRNKNEYEWNKSLQYTLVSFDALRADFNVFPYWQSFTNQKTKLVLYDFEKGAVKKVTQNGKILPIAKVNKIESDLFLRSLVVVALFGASLCGIFMLYRANKSKP